jgi:hypothetical protein
MGTGKHTPPRFSFGFDHLKHIILPCASLRIGLVSPLYPVRGFFVNEVLMAAGGIAFVPAFCVQPIDFSALLT